MYRNFAGQRFGRFRAELAYTDIEQIIGRGLHEFLDGFQKKLNLADQAFSTRFSRCARSVARARCNALRNRFARMTIIERHVFPYVCSICWQHSIHQP
jgi:hypothetical protein